MGARTVKDRDIEGLSVEMCVVCTPYYTLYVFVLNALCIEVSNKRIGILGVVCV